MQWYHYLLIVLGSIIIIGLIVYCLMYINAINKKKKNNKIISEYYLNIIDSVGGLDNISDVSYVSSRLSFILFDYSKIDDNKLKEININGMVKTSKKITLVVGEMASLYCESIKKLLNSKKGD